MNICQLDGILNDAKEDFRWLIAFMLAGYVGVSVATWAVRRQNYAALCGKCEFYFLFCYLFDMYINFFFGFVGNARNINILLASFLPLETEHRDIMMTRR